MQIFPAKIIRHDQNNVRRFQVHTDSAAEEFAQQQQGNHQGQKAWYPNCNILCSCEMTEDNACHAPVMLRNSTMSLEDSIFLISVVTCWVTGFSIRTS